MLTKDRIPISFILKKIKKQVLFVSFYMIFIFYVDEILKLEKSLYIPTITLSILGTCISLILGFKTNHSYQRWVNARNSWGAIKSSSVHLSRQIKFFLTDSEENIKESVKFIKRQIAITYITEKKLRDKNINSIIDKYISDEEKNYVYKFENTINLIFNLQFRHLQELRNSKKIELVQEIELINTLNNIWKNINVCIGIKKTVFPVIYSLYVRWMLNLFVIILPLGLIEFNKYIEVLLVITISGLFFLMENTSNLLQDPFENLPTDVNALSLATDTEIEIKQIFDLPDIPEKVDKNDFYVM